jgi:bacterial/archaeal transporter family-2 protein
MSLLFGFLALVCGVVLTSQIGSNALLGKLLGDSYIPAAVNMLIGVITTAILLVIVHKPLPAANTAGMVPWWAWIAGGVLGTIYLTGNILLAPKLGAGALVGLVVTGQLLFAVLCDHFGWLGFAQHSVTALRAVGCLLLIGGVALIAKF